MWKYFKWSTWHRLYIKIVKNDGTPHSLAMGLAIGVFAGFIVPTGGQIIIAIALAWLLRCSKILAVMGTLITNPWTGPIFIPIECWIGGLLLGYDLSLPEITRQFGTLMTEPSFESLKNIGMELIFSLLLGGAVFSVIFSIPTYYLALACVKIYRRRKELKLKLKETLLKKMHLDGGKGGESLPPPEDQR